MNKDALFKRPLFFLQLTGWTAYAVTDHIGHLMYGSNHFIASFGSGLSALLLTALLAVINKPLGRLHPVPGTLTFITLLFIGAVIWSNVFKVLHQHISWQTLQEQSIQQWLSGASFAFYLFVAWSGLLYLGSRYLSIQISNSKVAEKSGKSGTGTGLRNTEERLKVIYGGEARLNITDDSDRYRVELLLPWVGHFS